MTARQNDLLMIGLLAVQALIAGIVLADPAELGLSTTLVRWLVILGPILTLVANQLKALGAAGNGQSPLQQPRGNFADAPVPDPTLTRGGNPPPP